jgi:hypothetical protein
LVVWFVVGLVVGVGVVLVVVVVVVVRETVLPNLSIQSLGA